MTREIEKSLLDLDFAELTRRKYTPSPAAWEDQMLYFLLVDRFSDGNERGGHRDNDGRPVNAGRTPLYTVHDSGSVDYDTWLKAGGIWQGGTLKGLKSKLGYLKRLGVTALWVSPIFRQVAFEPTSYHGYGIQDFLDVDPHFGTREDFRDFVDAAHEHGIYVILDIIAHHTGNVFTYATDRYPVRDPGTGETHNDPRWDGKPYTVQGFNDRHGRPTIPGDAPDSTRFETAWPGFDSGGRPSGSDLVLRESMFGGSFGGKCTQGRHFFDEDAALYRALAALIDLREKLLPLRRGRQMLHEISGDGIDFGVPRLMSARMRSIVAWSRLFVDQEVLVGFSTDQEQPLTAYSTVAPRFRAQGDLLKLIFWHTPAASSPPPQELVVERWGERLAVRLTVPPAGFVIYQAAPGLDRLASS